MDFLKLLSGMGLVILGAGLVGLTVLLIVTRTGKARRTPLKGEAVPLDSLPTELDEEAARRMARFPALMDLARKGLLSKVLSLIEESQTGDLFIKSHIQYSLGLYPQCLKSLESLVRNNPDDHLARIFYLQVLLKMDLAIPAEVNIRFLLEQPLDQKARTLVKKLGERIAISSEEAALCDYFTRWFQWLGEAGAAAPETHQAREELHQLTMCREALKQSKAENAKLRERLAAFEDHASDPY